MSDHNRLVLLEHVFVRIRNRDKREEGVYDTSSAIPT